MDSYEKLQFSSDLPYPEITVENINRFYGKAMLDNLGGENSEISAVSRYFYDHLVTGDFKDISYIFHKISIVEMRHLEIFGKLALLLGENPRLWTYRGKRPVYWSPGYNKYPPMLKDILILAWQGECATVKKYRRQIEAICDPHIQKNLERIIIDELIHIQILESLLHDYVPSFSCQFE